MSESSKPELVKVVRPVYHEDGTRTLANTLEPTVKAVDSQVGVSEGLRENGGTPTTTRRKRSIVPSSSHALRKVARERLSNVQHILEQVATGAIADESSVSLQCPECQKWSRHKVEIASPGDRIKAIATLSGIGLPSQSEVVVNEEVRDKLRETLAILESALADHPELRESVMTELDGVWSE